MKKTIAVFLSLLILAFFAACSNDKAQDEGDGKDKDKDTVEETKEIDPLLVGGYWREFVKEKIGTSDILYYYLPAYMDYEKINIYDFTETTFYKCSAEAAFKNNKKFVAETTTEAYTKNGVLYSLKDNTELFSYTKITSDYFQTAMQNLIDANPQQINIAAFMQIKEQADEGRVIMIKTPPDNIEVLYVRLDEISQTL
jgi:hypothetical protein